MTWIQSKNCGDESAEFTISVDGEDHRFSAARRSGEESVAVVEYEETLSWRGGIRVSPPEPSVWYELMRSPEMSDWLDEQHIDRVVRDR